MDKDTMDVSQRLGKVLEDILVSIGRLNLQVADLARRAAVLENDMQSAETAVSTGQSWLDAMIAAGWRPARDVFGNVYGLYHDGSGARIEGAQVDAWRSLAAVPPALVMRQEVRSLQPCGHPTTSVVSSDDGTSFCADCEQATEDVWREHQRCANCGEWVRGTKYAPDVPVHLNGSRLCQNMKTFAQRGSLPETAVSGEEK